jgi:hypothetical protein
MRTNGGQVEPAAGARAKPRVRLKRAVRFFFTNYAVASLTFKKKFVIILKKTFFKAQSRSPYHYPSRPTCHNNNPHMRRYDGQMSFPNIFYTADTVRHQT